MASHFLRFILLVWLVGFCLSSTAAVPTFMPYQGFLADSAGEPVSGSRDMHFSLHKQASGGTPIWAETHTAVAVTAGFFQVELGSIEPLDDSLFDAPLFLGIRINTEAEMSPRMRIGSVPFARAAGGLLACNVGETNCNGSCADLQTDAEHCSACGLSCGPGEVCVLGVCGTCTPQTYYRDDDTDYWGQCSDSIQACAPTGVYSATQCGDCDDADPAINPGAPEICDDGSDNNCNGFVDCEDPGCPGGGNPGWIYCISAGSCVDPQSDAQHCSACDLACTGGGQCADPICVGGSCSIDGSPYEGNTCDDQNACTVSDSCQLGSCGGTPIDCNDGNECTFDNCSPLTGCVYSPVADGTPCAGGTCNAGTCQP